MFDNETDETNCDEWPCETPYTRCDGFWQCADGRDELNCMTKPSIHPPSCNPRIEHICINPISGLWGCVPQSLAGDGYVHCLGASDERALCRNAFPHEPRRRFLCGNSLNNTIDITNIECIDVTRVCDCLSDCPAGDDELVCPWLKAIVDGGNCLSEKFHCQLNKSRPFSRHIRCDGRQQCFSKEDEILCDLITPKKEIKYFELTRSRMTILTRYMPPLPSFWLRVHLVYTAHRQEPNQEVVFQPLDLHNTSMTILLGNTPDLAFLELDNQQIYLILILQPSYIFDLGTLASVRNLSLDFIPSNRCPHVGELLPIDRLSDNPLRRIKYYQRPCREHPSLRCFYDETRMCLCTHQNNTDCFSFDLKTKFECYGYNYCENGGQCYQSHPVCPDASQCSCVECYFGTR
ncbi:unnamed protein product, partial [Rotaria sp. Silwood2]